MTLRSASHHARKALSTLAAELEALAIHQVKARIARMKPGQMLKFDSRFGKQTVWVTARNATVSVETTLPCQRAFKDVRAEFGNAAIPALFIMATAETITVERAP